MTGKSQARTGPRADKSVTPFDPRAVLEQALVTANEDADDGELEWDERELTLLSVIDRQAHHIRALEAELAVHGYIDTGSKGQVRVSPIVSELRLQYAALARVAEAIRLPGEVVPQKSVRHQRAARRRWS